MKDQLKKSIEIALKAVIKTGNFPKFDLPEIHFERTKDKIYGDFATNIALVLAKPAKMNPRRIASLLVEAMPSTNFITKVDIAGQGFINFTLSADLNLQIVKEILSSKENFGNSNIGQGKLVQVEFVSANPTGPLHVGHGRGAVYGSVISNLLTATGFNVHREYYVNDAGRHMDILAISVWLRYLNACGENLNFPNNGYKGSYVIEIANTLFANYGNKFFHPVLKIFTDIPPDTSEGGDKERHIDALINKAKLLLGESDYRKIFNLGLNVMLSDISNDLSDFGSHYDEWFSELSLIESGEVDNVLKELKYANVLYQHDGAWWFRSTDFGDEKDRVVVRDNGQITYFASDIAYHLNKFQRGFDEVIDVWGSDHHGYIPRIKASLMAMNQDKNRLKVLLVQFAVLYRGYKKVAMSTRSGQFVTLRQLREEVGKDAARFFYIMRGADQHMDFDLELAKSQSKDNPVYYVQYAHARVCSVFRQLKERDLSWDRTVGETHLGLLIEEHERNLFTLLARYPEVLEMAALNHTPHILAHFLTNIARNFHVYYNAHQFMIDNVKLSQARLTLVVAVRQVIFNGLTILGISAPESM